MKNRGRKTLLNKIGMGFKTGILAAALSILPMKNANPQRVINPYVPANENGIELLDMKTKAQRDSLVQAFLDEDWNDASHIPGKKGAWDCTEYKTQGLTNNYDWGENINLYDGYKGEPIPDSLYAHGGTSKDKGKGGLPFMGVRLNIPSEQDHEQLAMITGDSLDGDITILENWNVTEPQFDQINVQPGQAYMPENCEVVISYPYVNYSQSQGYHLAYVPIIKFQVIDGKGECSWINDDPNLIIYKNRSTAIDQEFEEINISSPTSDSTYKNDDAVLKYKLKDKNLNLEKCYYKFNGETNYFSTSSGSIPLYSKEGLNELEIKAFDKAGNYKTEKRNYYYDPVTGINDLKKDNIYNFYPNPVSDILNIKGLENKKLEIYNANGQLLEKRIIEGDKLNVEEYKPGMYIIKVNDSKENYTTKIIKK